MSGASALASISSSVCVCDRKGDREQREKREQGRDQERKKKERQMYMRMDGGRLNGWTDEDIALLNKTALFRHFSKAFF